MNRLRISASFVFLFSVLITAPKSMSQDAQLVEKIEATTSVSKQKERAKRELRYELYFDPLVNGVKLSQQRIDYDLTYGSVLRMGPYALQSDDVSMHMSREQGEFVELEFGIEVSRRIGTMYVVSFRWPTDYVNRGTLEIINDKGRSYWRRNISNEDLFFWQKTISDAKEVERDRRERIKPKKRKALTKEEIEKGKKVRQLGLIRPKALSRRHWRSDFGLARKGFFEIPISEIKDTFRFCLSDEDKEGRIALCSKRYRIVRDAGKYLLRSVSTKVRPRVLVNDKPVTLKGSAIFLDNNTPIKFSAMLKNGTYYEFVSRPKEIKLVDMVYNEERDDIEMIGYGDAPLGQVDESYYANTAHWGFLNFMPTIGDLRKFWRAVIPTNNPFIYLKGHGGAPFRQAFEFKKLPTSEARINLSDETQKATYLGKVDLKGKMSPNIDISAKEKKATKKGESNFDWEFLAKKEGQFNTDYLLVEENGRTWKAGYEIYRGYSKEFSARLTGVVTDGLDLILIGEVAAQMWFESLLWMDSFYLSKLRWGASVKHFQTVASIGGDDSTVDVELAVSNVDIKYRLQPGIWGRDPTVGLLFSAQNVTISTTAEASKTMLGGGLFWARSMPRFFDDLFNIIPFFRYPKWVDMEIIWYLIPLTEGGLGFNSAFNFHGKINWTKRFFGEAGFGIKTFSFEDLDTQVAPTIGVAYGTVGLGFNF